MHANAMKWLLLGIALVVSGAADASDIVPVVIRGDAPPMSVAEALVDFGSASPRRPLPTSFGKQGSNLLWDERGRIKLDELAKESRFRRFLESSIEELEKYTVQFAEDADAWTVLGVRLYQTNNFEASIKAITMARAMDPTHERSAELLSGILVVSGKIQEAIEANEVILMQLPENTVVRFNLACALAREGRVEDAMYHLLFLADIEWGDLIYYLNDRDLDSARPRDEFKKLEERLAVEARAWVVSALEDK